MSALVFGIVACVCVAIRCVISAATSSYRPFVRIISGLAVFGWLLNAVQLGGML